MTEKFHYFETAPQGGRFDEGTYDEACRAMGRCCLDVAGYIGRSLVLLNRKVKPYPGPWLSGGRIVWDDFKGPRDYAVRRIKSELGLPHLEARTFWGLSPRFFCTEERPYPEMAYWGLVELTETEVADARPDPSKYNKLHRIASWTQLEEILNERRVGGNQRRALLELWEELRVLNLVD